MSNLHSFIELTPAKKALSDSPAAVASKEVDSLLKRLRSTQTFLMEHKQVESTKQLNTVVIEKLSTLRNRLFADELALPSQLLNAPSVPYYTKDELEWRGDTLTTLSQSPQTTLLSLRFLADRLSMVLIPLVALVKDSISEAPYEKQRAIQYFRNAAQKANMDIYVMCPISLYSVAQHAADQSSDPVSMYSARYESVLMAISMQLPLFRSINFSVKSLDSRVTTLESVSASIKTQVAALQVQVDRLQQQLEREVKARAVAEAKTEELRKQVAATEAAAFRAVDPMLFAVKKGQDLLGDGPAIVGPAWGPDLPQILVELANLKEIAGQSKKLGLMWQ